VSSVGRIGLTALAIVVLAAVVYVGGAWLHLWGELEHAGTPTDVRVPAEEVAARGARRADAAEAVGAPGARQILFGDLHVHTTFSTDAFLWSLPMLNGDGAHPVADACDYARFCSALDFWSINDHAEASTPRKWRETLASIEQCNAVAGDATDPDVVAFLGWEWTQVGLRPEEHYGHKNVIFRELDPEVVPPRPIGAAGLATEGLRGRNTQSAPWYLPLADFDDRERYFNFIRFLDQVRGIPFCPQGVPSPELPDDCYEMAATPRELFEKLDQWSEASGADSIVIPHGNTWGFYTPPGSSLDKQLAPGLHDADRQILFEVMSGHGNSEEYRDWRAVRWDADGEPVCPEPTEEYLPSCWRAGEIIDRRCREAGLDGATCEARAAEARRLYLEGQAAGHWAVPGVRFEEWLDAGQCRDCFLPSFNYRPRGSGQYALALRRFGDGEGPRRFRFGFIASSDNHRARPGTGYKEFDRLGTTEANGPISPAWKEQIYPRSEEPLPEPQEVDIDDFSRGFGNWEAERQASFFMTGGLAAVHATGRHRDAVWSALRRREVYGTSGDRILLWFDLVNAGGAERDTRVAMGGSARMDRAPRFEVRAVGAHRQKPGCPEHAADAVGPERLEWLCRGECHHPSDERKRITRIEVVRIRPQSRAGEDVGRLIEDPWKTLPCDDRGAGCTARFEDPEFAGAGRDTIYYVRAIEEPSPAVNADHLRCRRDEHGDCLEVSPCYGGYRTPDSDDCLATIEERAWSSPIFVDWAS